MINIARRLGLLALLAVGSAQAGPSLVTSMGALGANDDVNWSQLGAEGDSLAASFSAMSTNSHAVTGALAGPAGYVAVAGSSWSTGAGFSAGDTVIWTEDSNYNGSGPLSLSFQAVLGAGLYIQANTSGPYTASISAYNGASLLGTFTEQSNAAGAGVFIGVLNSQANITRISVGLSACAAGCSSADFGVNALQLREQLAAVPEPATMCLMLLGSLGLAGLRRQQLRATIKNTGETA